MGRHVPRDVPPLRGLMFDAIRFPRAFALGYYPTPPWGEETKASTEQSPITDSEAESAPVSADARTWWRTNPIRRRASCRAQQRFRSCREGSDQIPSHTVWRSARWFDVLEERGERLGVPARKPQRSWRGPNDPGRAAPRAASPRGALGSSAPKPPSADVRLSEFPTRALRRIEKISASTRTAPPPCYR
jgi:hypothetical protein